MNRLWDLALLAITFFGLVWILAQVFELGATHYITSPYFL